MRMFRVARYWLLGLAILVAATSLALLPACEDEEEEEATPTPTAAAETPSPAASPAAGGPLKIGSLNTFTGSLGEFGESISKGAELAVAQCNEVGGVLGADVEFSVADTQTTPTVGVDAARRLVDIGGVQTIPGKILLISPASTAATIAELDDDDMVFRTTVSDDAQGAVLAQLAYEDLGYTKVGVMADNNPYGVGLAETFKSNFEALGGEATIVKYEENQPTYLAEVQQATEGDPDALACIGYPVEAQVYIREALENELADTFLFVDGTRSVDLPTNIGPEYLEGMYGTDAGTVRVEQLVNDYEAQFGETFPVTPFTAQAYDAAALLCLAANKAGSTDPEAIRDALREVSSPPGQTVTAGVDGLTEALELIAAGTDVDYEGYASSTDFDENGDVAQGAISIWQYINGVPTGVRDIPVEFSE